MVVCGQMSQQIIQSLPDSVRLWLEQIQLPLEQWQMHAQCKTQTQGVDLVWPARQESVLFLFSGLAEINYLNSEGKKVIVDQLRPVSCLSSELFVSSGVYFVHFLHSSWIAIIAFQVVVEWMKQWPGLSVWLVLNNWQMNYRLIKKTASLAGDNAYQRLIKLLLQLGEAEGRQQGKLLILSTRYTHEQLAQMLGITRQTLTSLLSCLENNCLITRQAAEIVFDPERLQLHLETD